MTRYGMAIDLDRCIGCHACALACTMHHGLPDGVRWSRVRESTTGTWPNLETTCLPTACMQCTDAPCAEVCPTGATYKTDEGIVLVHAAECIGCGSCATACPYGARQLVPADGPSSNHKGSDLTAYEEHLFGMHVANTMEKCTFCSDRLEEGKLPWCVDTCVANARVFGDLDDASSDVAKMAAAGEVLLKSEGTNPSVFYSYSGNNDLDSVFAK